MKSQKFTIVRSSKNYRFLRCQKPNPGMILDAVKEFIINPVNSVLIGDKKSDILAGKSAGLGKNIYIQDLLTGDR